MDIELKKPENTSLLAQQKLSTIDKTQIDDKDLKRLRKY
jgi:hypothetical protein